MKNGTLALCGALLAALGAFAGCGDLTMPFGQSLDRHVFHSTAHLPVNLTLKDTVTGEVVWTLQVPVQHKAVIQLDHEKTWTSTLENATPANKLTWGVYPETKDWSDGGKLPNKQTLNGNPVLLEWQVRKTRGIDATPVAGS